MKHSAEVIVAGLGAMGSAALYQLAKKGIAAIGIDQFAPPHTLGSSHGETRITRSVTGQGLEYTPLVLRANEIWRELEKEAGRTLMTITGGLIVGADDSLTTQEQSKYLPTIKEAARKYNISHEVLSAQNLQKRFLQFRFRGNEQGYYEHSAGILRPELCVDTHVSLARKLGARTNFNERILKFSPVNNDSVSVTTDKGEYEAQRLIVSAGPWISNFFPQYQQLFRVCRQVLYWFDVPGEITPYLPGNFPVFIFILAGGNAFYGFPAIDGVQGGMKMATENYAIATTPEQVNRDISPQEARNMYEHYVRPYLPGVSDRCLKAATCLYTLTPDFNFIIDLLPGAPQIVMASPCSGHGFKYSAAIGEALVELAIQQKTTINLDKFKLSRLMTGAVPH